MYLTREPRRPRPGDSQLLFCESHCCGFFFSYLLLKALPLRSLRRLRGVTHLDDKACWSDSALCKGLTLMDVLIKGEAHLRHRCVYDFKNKTAPITNGSARHRRVFCWL
jgi:hypothetical protein